MEPQYSGSLWRSRCASAISRRLPGTPTLGKLTQAILRHVPDLPRLRISSIDSIEADPKLMEDALASPGKVIKKVRGSADEQTLAMVKRRLEREFSVVGLIERFDYLSTVSGGGSTGGSASGCGRSRRRRPRCGSSTSPMVRSTCWVPSWPTCS